VRKNSSANRSISRWASERAEWAEEAICEAFRVRFRAILITTTGSLGNQLSHIRGF
jgi:hypothetical protein